MHNMSRQKYSRIHFQSGPFRTQILHNDGQLLMPTYGWMDTWQTLLLKQNSLGFPMYHWTSVGLADTAPKPEQSGIPNVPLDVCWLGRHCS